VNVSISELERRMRLGGWYTHPMLLKGDSLSRTINSDVSILNTLNSTAKSIGEKMFSLIYQAKDTDWFRPISKDKFTIEIHRSRGLITCPWASEEFEPCTFDNWPASSDEFKISNKVNRITIKGLILSVHMIQEHSFFGGRGTSSRIEPCILAKVLFS
jgi:hypothetical protein